MNILSIRLQLIVSLFFLTLTSCVEEAIVVEEVSAVRVNSLTVISYPVTNGGVSWDDPFLGAATGADLSWSIAGPQNFTSTTYFPDADGTPVIFQGDEFPLFLNNPRSSYTLRLIDLDDLDASDLLSEDDIMAELVFVPYSEGSEGDLTLEYSSGSTTVQLDVTYLFD